MKFDKYWVASWFVRPPAYISQASRSRTSAVTISFLLVALASLLTFAVPARGEAPALTEAATEATAAATAAVEVPSPPAEAPVAAATTESANVPSSTPASTPTPETDEAVEVQAVAAKIDSTVETVAAASGSKAANDGATIDTLAKTAGETVTQATGTATGGSPTRTFDKAADTGAPLLDPVKKAIASTPVDRVREAMGSVRILELTHSVIESIRALSELANPAQKIGDLLHAVETPATGGPTSPTGVPVLSSPSPSLPAWRGDLAGPASPTDERAMTEVAPSFLLAHAGADLSRQPLSTEGRGAGVHSLAAMARDGYSDFGGAVQQSGGRTPAEAPTPAPGSTQAAAGSSGLTFIPLAALLALLALAAPATGRRLGKAAGFRPSVPFVCALERPG